MTTLENYFVMKQFWGKEDKYLRIPLPQFWRGFHAWGVSLYDFAVKNKITAGEVAGKTLSNMIAGMAPIDITGFIQNGEFSWEPFIPTTVKPVSEIINNRNFMGNKITREPFTLELERKLADSGLHKQNVNPAAKLLTDIMFRMTGGEGKYKFYFNEKGELKYVPGILDNNPSNIEHLVNSYFGGTGKFLNDFVTTMWQAVSKDQEVDWDNVPFFNSFVRNVPEEKMGSNQGVSKL